MLGQPANREVQKPVNLVTYGTIWPFSTSPERDILLPDYLPANPDG
jgi:hypothetical protein